MFENIFLLNMIGVIYKFSTEKYKKNIKSQ